jgi:hypothetical protein
MSPINRYEGHTTPQEEYCLVHTKEDLGNYGCYAKPLPGEAPDLLPVDHPEDVEGTLKQIADVFDKIYKK